MPDSPEVRSPLSRAKMLLVAVLLFAVSGCTPAHAALVVLMGCALADSAASSASRTQPRESNSSSSPPRRPPASVAVQADGWQAKMASGQAAYRHFRFDACRADLTAVIDDATAPASVRAVALTYRGAANFLVGDADGARRDFGSAKRLGGRIDTGIFRPDIVDIYDRCSATAM